MRCDQFMGLNPWASKFTDGEKKFLYTEEVVLVYPSGKRETQPPREVYGTTCEEEDSGKKYHGMMDSEYDLSKYTFDDGRVFYEEVQAEPWSSGPVFFLALKDEKGEWVKESMWTDEEIQRQ